MIYFNPDPKPEARPKGEKYFSSIKQKTRKVTGEKALFDRIYEERKGECAITKLPVPNKPINFMHILGKGAYPMLRLKRYNILLVQERIHDLYDNSSMEKLCAAFPGAFRIYELKVFLKEKVNSKHFDREED